MWQREGNNGGGRRGLTSSSEHDGPKTPDPKVPLFLNYTLPFLKIITSISNVILCTMIGRFTVSYFCKTDIKETSSK